MIEGIFNFFFNQSRLGYVEITTSLQNQKLRTVSDLKFCFSHLRPAYCRLVVMEVATGLLGLLMSTALLTA